MDLLTGHSTSTISKLVTEDHPSASRHPQIVIPPTHYQYFLNLLCNMHRNEIFTSLTQFRPQLPYKCSHQSLFSLIPKLQMANSNKSEHTVSNFFQWTLSTQRYIRTKFDLWQIFFSLQTKESRFLIWYGPNVILLGKRFLKKSEKKLTNCFSPF